MVEREKILQALYAAVDELNLQLPAESRLEKAETTAIIGDDATLDSRGFINLILSAETKVNEVCSPPINVSERMIEHADSHPETLGAFATFITGLQEG